MHYVLHSLSVISWCPCRGRVGRQRERGSGSGRGSLGLLSLAEMFYSGSVAVKVSSILREFSRFRSFATMKPSVYVTRPDVPSVGIDLLQEKLVDFPSIVI